MRPRLRISVALAGACLIGFLLLAWAVSSGVMVPFDRTLLVAFRSARDPGDPLGPEWLTHAFENITSLGSHVLLGILVAITIGFLWLDGKRHGALLILLSALGAVLLSALLKNTFERPRPDLVLHLAKVSSPSFPSGHALLSATIFLMLGVLISRVQTRRGLRVYPLVVAIVLTAAIGVSRLFLGVHWPSDVLAGWLIGAGWALVCYATATWLQQRGMVEGGKPASGEPRRAAGPL